MSSAGCSEAASSRGRRTPRLAQPDHQPSRWRVDVGARPARSRVNRPNDGAWCWVLLRLPGEPSLYLSEDTVLTNDVCVALERERPDVAILHSGGAQLDIGSPILMTLEEQLEFVRLAPGRVIAVHLEALGHCAITRAKLKDALQEAGAFDYVDIPADGQTIPMSGTATDREKSLT